MQAKGLCAVFYRQKKLPADRIPYIDRLEWAPKQRASCTVTACVPPSIVVIISPSIQSVLFLLRDGSINHSPEVVHDRSWFSFFVPQSNILKGGKCSRASLRCEQASETAWLPCQTEVGLGFVLTGMGANVCSICAVRRSGCTRASFAKLRASCTLEEVVHRSNLGSIICTAGLSFPRIVPRAEVISSTSLLLSSRFSSDSISESKAVSAGASGEMLKS